MSYEDLSYDRFSSATSGERAEYEDAEWEWRKSNPEADAADLHEFWIKWWADLDTTA